MALNTEELLFKISTQVGGSVAIGELARQFVELNSKVENLIRGLTAITGSSEEAEKTFAYLQDTSQKLGVNLLDLSNGYMKLAAAAKGTNLEGDATVRIFESLTSAMSVLGGDAVTTNRAFVALAQMMSKGQIYAEELRGQLAEALPDAIQVMAKALNIGTDTLYQLMQAGALSSDVLLPFADELDRRYGGLAASSNTFTQSVNRMKETLSQSALDIEKTSGLYDGLKSVLKLVADNGQLVTAAIGAGLAGAVVKLTQVTVTATVAMKEKIAVLMAEGNASQRAAKAAADKAATDLAAAQAAARQAAIAQQQALLTEERTNMAIASRQREVASIQAKMAVVTQEELAQKRLVNQQLAETSARDRLRLTIDAETAAVQRVAAAHGEAVVAATKELTVATRQAQLTGAAVIERNAEVRAIERKIVAVEAEVNAIRSGVTLTELQTAATQKLNTQQAILTERQLAASAATTRYGLAQVALTEVLKSRNFTQLLTQEQELLKTTLANTAAADARRLKAESQVLVDKQRVASIIEVVNKETQLNATTINQLLLERERLKQKVAQGAATATEIAQLDALNKSNQNLIITKNALASSERTLAAAQDRYLVQRNQQMAVEQRLNVQLYDSLSKQTVLAAAEAKRAEAAMRRASLQWEAAKRAVAAAEAEVISLNSATAASDRLTAAQERLAILKDKLLASTERKAAADLAAAQATDRLTAATNALNVAGVEETAVAARNLAIKTLAADQATQGLARTQQQILASQQRVASLVAEGGSAAVLATAEAELALAKEQANISAQRSVVAGEAVVKARAQEAAAAAAAAAANQKLAQSQSLMGRIFNFNNAMIVAMIASFVYMYAKFREQDEATKALTGSTEEYTEALEKMTAAQVAQTNIKSKSMLKEQQEYLSGLQLELRQLESLIARGETLGELTRQRIINLKWYNDLSEVQADLASKIDEAQKQLAITEGKREQGLTSLIAKSAELRIQEQEEIKNNAELKKQYDEQRQQWASLNTQLFKNSEEKQRLAVITEQYTKTQKDLNASSARLIGLQNSLSEAERNYVEQTGLSIEQVRTLISGHKLEESALSAKSKAIVDNIQQQLRLAKEGKALESQLRQSKAEYDRLEKSLKANAEAIRDEAVAMGDVVTQRQAEIELANLQERMAQQTLETEKLQLRQMENLLETKQRQMELSSKASAEMHKEVEKLKVQVITQRSVVDQKEAAIRAAQAEAEATRQANTLISQSFARNQETIARVNREVADLQAEYRNLSGLSETVFNQRQVEILQQIAEKQREAGQAARNLGMALSDAYKTLGLNAEESLAGMDFQTRRMIDAFSVLGQTAKLSALDIERAFANLLTQANTEREIQTLKDAWIELANQGVLSADQMSDGLARLRERLVDIRIEASPTQRALEQLGLGIPEQLNAVANSARVAFEILRDGQAPLETLRQGFLEYAQAAIEAAAQGGELVDPTVQQQAAALGLSTAYAELTRSLRQANPEFTAINDQFDRSADQMEQRRQVLDAMNEADAAWLAVAEEQAQALAGESELRATLIAQAEQEAAQAQEQATLDQQDLNLAQARLQALESLIRSGQTLSVEQEEELNRLREELAAKRQTIEVSQAKAIQSQAEADAVRRANTLISEELNRQQTVMDGLIQELTSLQGEYQRLTEAGVPLELLTDLLEQIRLKQESVLTAAQDMDKALAEAYRAIGLNAEEALTGMDFQTRRAIDAFNELAKAGHLSAGQLQTAFTDVLAKANTEAELNALRQSLIDLGVQGRLSGEAVAQGLATIQVKLTEIKAAVDPVQIALEKLGVGVPEKLKAISDEQRVLYETVLASKAPLDEVDQAFLKYAESALTAAENGAQVNLSLIEQEAKARGLWDAYQALVEKIREADPQFEGLTQTFVRQREETERGIEVIGRESEKAQERLSLSRELATARGDEAEATRLAAIAALEALDTAQRQVEALQNQRQEILNQIAVLTQQAQASDGISQAEREIIQALEEKAAALDVDIAKLQARLPLLQREREETERAAGPIGELIRLYQRRIEEATRETGAIERSYDAKLRDIDVEIKQAQAKGDTTKVQQLKIEKAELEAQAAQAVANAIARQMDLEIKLAEAKKLEIAASDLSLKAKQREIAILNELIAKKREAADAAQDNANAAKAEAQAAKESAQAASENAQATNQAADAKEGATKSTSRLATALDIVKFKYKDLTEEGIRFATEMTNAGDTVYISWIRYMSAQNEIRKSIESALSAERARAAQIQQLNDLVSEGGNRAETAQRQLVNMALSGNAGLRGLTQSGEQAIQVLEGIRQSAMQAESALLDMANNFKKQILQIQGDQRALLQLEHQENLARLEELYQKSGQLGTDEYQMARARATELHSLKIRQMQEEEKADQTAERFAKTAEQAERLNKAMGGLAQTSLANLNTQTQTLHQNLTAVNALL